MAPLATARPATATRKRHSIGALLPPTVAWLEPLALSVHVDTPAVLSSSSPSPRSTLRQRHTAHYTLTLQLKQQQQQQSVHAHWTLQRSFEDYRAFQKRLLQRMQHGHFCSAECPWLFMFVKSYFPKQTLFRTRPCARLAQRRCDALLRYFTALQTFLLSRANHSCAVVVDHVAAELLHFVLQDASPDHPLKRAVDSANQRTNSSNSSSGAGRVSSDSVASTSDGDDSSSATDAESLVCGLCDCSLEAEPSCSRSSPRLGPEPNVLEATASGASYMTVLSCGHAFHDECIVPKLNDAMQCPTCGTAQTTSD